MLCLTPLTNRLMKQHKLPDWALQNILTTGSGFMVLTDIVQGQEQIGECTFNSWHDATCTSQQGLLGRGEDDQMHSIWSA